VIGLLVGNFLNVLIWRLPKMLEREWRLQPRHSRAARETPLPTYNLLLFPVPAACTGFGLEYSAAQFPAAWTLRLARHRSANDTH
jgi:prepilin signal peptidase PulO-like enzyme (type II secretory pathway)